MILPSLSQTNLIISMLVVEIWILSVPKYSIRIGNENYFSLTVGAAIGLFFLFLFCVIKFGNQKRSEKKGVNLILVPPNQLTKNKINPLNDS